MLRGGLQLKLICRPIPSINKDKFYSKIDISNEENCWEWKGSISSYGYGMFSIRGVEFRAHRIAYHLKYGIKELHTVIDHKCMNKSCVNPDHLREVTIRINVIENSKSLTVNQIKQTHCMRGHEFTPENTYVQKPGVYGGRKRKCRACSIARTARVKLSKKGSI